MEPISTTLCLSGGKQMIINNEENQNCWVTFINGVTSCFLKCGVYLSTPPSPPAMIDKDILGFQLLVLLSAGRPKLFTVEINT